MAEQRFGLSLFQWDKMCNRCGECCRLVDKNGTKLTREYCPALVWNKDGTACCTVYHFRYGYVIQQGSYCGDIGDSVHRDKDCPYNKFFGKSEL